MMARELFLSENQLMEHTPKCIHFGLGVAKVQIGLYFVNHETSFTVSNIILIETTVYS